MKSISKKIAEEKPLALVIKRKMIVSSDIVMLSAPRSVHAERFRRLKTTLVHTHGDQLRNLVVTSAVAGEGKSTVAVNLALAFAAEGGARTLLVDGDLMRPSIAKKIEPAPPVGLVEVLTGKVDPSHAVVRLNNSPLHVLPAGAPSDAHELLASREAAELFRAFRERYDRIVVDSPPIVLFADADALGALSDGIIMVAHAGETPSSAYAQAISNVTSTRVLGTVLNRASRRFSGGKGDHDERYHAYYGEARKKKH